MRGIFPCALLLTLMLAVGGSQRAKAQDLPLSLPGVSAAPAKQFVALASRDAIAIAAGKAAVVEVRFRVNPGLHIHSHTPSSEFYIPTALTLAPEPGVVVKSLEYPPGQSYSFSFSPKEKLSVYQGDFALKALVVAAKGSHTLTGSLRYQACDNASCFPPRTLPVSVVVVAR